MHDDNSEACDEAARAEDKCYTRGRLRDEFKMKPAAGAEPVRMYKSPYGGKYGVWRQDYNECRPHSSLNFQTPVEFAVGWRNGENEEKPIDITN